MDNSCENEAGKSLLSEPTTSSTSFPESGIDYHNSNEVDDLYRNDLRPTCLDSGDVTVEEGYTSPDTASVGGVGSPARRPSTGQAHNIPYMQLFHHLKQQFPDLKDCDINESIQKFGLDRGRCEAELQQRAVAHTSGYYGPWGRTTGNWSTRSSPAPTPTRSDTPFTAHTTPSTPVMSPITSPFASQVPIPSHPSQNSRSAPVLVGPPTLVGPPLDVNICPVSLAQTNCVVTTANSQYALLVSSSSSSPTGMTPSSARAGNRHMSSSAGVTSSCSGHPHLVSTPSETIHTATTQHYVASHPITPSLNDIVYRQHSTSTDTTLTEEESMGGSNLTSPTSTLPLSPSPQPQGCSHSPNFSLESREQLQYAGPPVQFCAPPLQHLPPNSRAAHPSQYHQPHAPLVYPTSPHLYGWNPPVNSVPQNYTIGDRPVNESNHIADYPNSIHLENYLVGPGRIPGALNSYSSGIPLARQEFIPNITSSPASYTTNSSRRSRSTTPGVVLSPPTSAPVVSSSYEPFGGSYLYQHGEARRRRSEHVPLEPVRVAPPPPSAPSARETNYFPGDSSLNDKLSNLHINPSLLGGSPTVPALTTTSAATPRTHPAVPSSRPSGGLDRVASSSGVGHSSGVPSTAAGAKHVASLHFVPTPPHSAHLIACPPPNKGSLELSDRSYTSVNLRLRQPSSDPQPAIDIKSSGSCLTYSTSSLDRRQGSRSSLQISIGPAGGSISAMRTNLSTELNRGNAALHIQYRAGDDSDDHPNGGGGDDDECPAGVAEAAFPTTRDVHHFPPKPMYRSSSGGAGQRSNGGVPYRVRPQSWYVSPTWQEQRTDTADLMTSSVGLSNTNSLLHPSRRNSMPDSVRLAEAYAEEEQRRRQQQESVVLGEEGACPIDSEVPWSAGEALYVQGLVAEQRTRHQRLLAVLQEGRAEFQSLKQEVNRLESTLALRRQQGDRAGAANAQRIEAIQEENRRLQSECDQMEGDILQTGEEPEVLDEEYCPLPSIPGARETGVGNPASQLPFSPAHSRLPPNRTPPSGSVRPEVPRRLTPTRTAPPPPLVGATAHNIPNFVSYEQDEGRGPGDGSGDDAGEGRWSCNRCTYDNHPAMSSCEICGAIRMPGSSPLQQPPPRSGGGGGGNSSSSTAGHQQNQQAPLVRAQSTQPKPLKSFD